MTASMNIVQKKIIDFGKLQTKTKIVISLTIIKTKIITIKTLNKTFLIIEA
jgi:hypothetical protein